MTEEQALKRLASLCVKGEHCSQDMLDKLYKWEISEEAQARIMEYLVKNHFIDDARYCEAFVKDKIQYNGWGRRKVEQALYLKHISKDISTPILDAIPDEWYLEKLRPLISKKWDSVKARNQYERSMKVIQYAMSRGFDFRLIKICLEAVGDDIDDDFIE